MSRAKPFISTSHGTASGPFRMRDWYTSAAIVAMWGSAPFFIDVSVDDINPGTITWLRLFAAFLMFLILSRIVSQTNIRIDREDWLSLLLVAITWFAFPFTLYPIAQQWIDSSLAGIIVGALRLFTAALASALLKVLPSRTSITGLAVGFGGVILVSYPYLGEADSTALGTAMILVAVSSYAVATNLLVPLAQKYPNIILTTYLTGIAAVLTTPFGIYDLWGSEFTLPASSSLVVVGLGASGISPFLFGMLSARVGATRSAGVNYLIPLVAALMGTIILNEKLELLSAIGLFVIILGVMVLGLDKTKKDLAKS